jgi:hypothetical protein
VFSSIRSLKIQQDPQVQGDTETSKANYVTAP